MHWIIGVIFLSLNYHGYIMQSSIGWYSVESHFIFMGWILIVSPRSTWDEKEQRCKKDANVSRRWDVALKKTDTKNKKTTFQRSRHSKILWLKIFGPNFPPSKSRLSGDHITTNKGMFGHHLTRSVQKTSAQQDKQFKCCRSTNISYQLSILVTSFFASKT